MAPGNLSGHFFPQVLWVQIPLFYKTVLVSPICVVSGQISRATSNRGNFGHGNGIPSLTLLSSGLKQLKLKM